MATSDVLSRSELFGELPAAFLNEIAGICREVEVSKGEVIFRIGDLSKDVFLLAEGSVELGYGAISADESKPERSASPEIFLAGEPWPEREIIGLSTRWLFRKRDSSSSMACSSSTSLRITRGRGSGSYGSSLQTF